jgi:hypothetical protein
MNRILSSIVTLFLLQVLSIQQTFGQPSPGIILHWTILLKKFGGKYFLAELA